MHWKKNPRRNGPAVDKVVASMRRFGFGAPLLARRANREIVAGHTRALAAQKLGVELVPVRFLDLSEEDAHLLALADNKLGEIAEWDDDGVLEILSGYSLDDAALAGWDKGDLEALAQNVGAPGGEQDDDTIPDMAAEVITKPGDIWELGKHRLICGDSTDSEVVRRLFDGRRASLCFTSPPYNVGRSSSIASNRTMAARKGAGGQKYVGEDARPLSDFRRLLDGFTRNALDFCDVVAVNLQMVEGNKLALIEYLHGMREHLVDVAIWHKGFGQPAMAAKVMNSAFEFVFLFSPEKHPGRSVPTAGFRGTVPNVYEAPPQNGGGNEFSDVHAATFPVHLPTWGIESFNAKREAVFEPFGGTGTTLIAAERTGCQCFAVELEPLYCDVIVRRWEALTGKTAVLARAP